MRTAQTRTAFRIHQLLVANAADDTLNRDIVGIVTLIWGDSQEHIETFDFTNVPDMKDSFDMIDTEFGKHEGQIEDVELIVEYPED